MIRMLMFTPICVTFTVLHTFLNIMNVYFRAEIRLINLNECGIGGRGLLSVSSVLQLDCHVQVVFSSI